MALQASTFLFDEEVAIAGERLRVVGQWQYEDGKGMLVTRYHLRDRSNNLQLFQERSGVFQFLRSFPPSMPPLAEGNTVTALGDRYVLGEVQKLKLFASAGQVPHEVLKSPLLLSGAFQGSNGSLLRELVPGAPTQTYYAVKYVEPTEIMNASRLVAADQTRKRELEESRRE